jgi:hypothetical protein
MSDMHEDSFDIISNFSENYLYYCMIVLWANECKNVLHNYVLMVISDLNYGR